ncbi:unnamed protein product [Lampetra fluviatilis]
MASDLQLRALAKPPRAARHLACAREFSGGARVATAPPPPPGTCARTHPGYFRAAAPTWASVAPRASPRANPSRGGSSRAVERWRRLSVPARDVGGGGAGRAGAARTFPATSAGVSSPLAARRFQAKEEAGTAPHVDEAVAEPTRGGAGGLINSGLPGGPFLINMQNGRQVVWVLAAAQGVNCHPTVGKPEERSHSEKQRQTRKNNQDGQGRAAQSRASVCARTRVLHVRRPATAMAPSVAVKVFARAGDGGGGGDGGDGSGGGGDGCGRLVRRRRGELGGTSLPLAARPA